MTVYVDALMNYGWKLGPSCHMFTDGELDELHALAARIGLKRSWFQQKPGGLPHYDLVASKRRAALAAGAVDDPEFEKLIELRKRLRRAGAAQGEQA